MARHQRNERGAAAVEFAIVLPVLLLMLLGIMEFGRAYNTQLSLTHAAREGVRVMAITNNPTAARATAAAAAVSLNPPLAPGNITVGSCAPGAPVTLTITYPLDTITGIAGPFTLTGQGVMLCGG